MKKTVLFALVAMIGYQANAQSANQAITKVNITLADVISIDQTLSAAAGGEINFNYAIAQDYNTIQNRTVANSLVVTSSTNFDIKVKANGEYFQHASAPTSKIIPVNALNIKAVTGGTMVGEFHDITLSNTDQMLVKGATLGAEASLTINYYISASNAQTKVLGKAVGVHTQYVTYTATAL